MIYNFINLINATARDFSPDVFYFAIDGRPTARLDIFPEYKSNRKKGELTEEEQAYWDSFARQKRMIVELCKTAIPVTTIYHPDEEADDLAYKFAKKHSGDDVVIITNDSDYIQIINELKNVRLFNPMKREYVSGTEYDYVSWKSMVGDPSDNIPGVKRVGKKTADKILKNGELSKRLEDDNFRKQYELAYSLIKMRDCFSMDDVEETKPVLRKDILSAAFKEFGFLSFEDGTILDEMEKNFSF